MRRLKKETFEGTPLAQHSSWLKVTPGEKVPNKLDSAVES
jgi:hypothetical protein